MVENVKELLAFGLAAGELISGIADGVGFDDLGKAVKAARLAAPAFKDAKLALDEYIGMQDSEALELEAFVMANFDIPDDAVESAIKMALKVVIELHDLAAIFKPKAA
jgi:hypothetical protein